MNRVIAAKSDSVFIVSTLSKSNLAQQNYESFVNLSENGTFTNINPFLINSDSSGEGSLYIPTDCNVYILPRDLYKDKSKLKVYHLPKTEGLDSEKQKVSHMIFFPRWHEYTQQEAIKEIKLSLKNTKHVKEVWLEWDGDEFKIKK